MDKCLREMCSGDLGENGCVVCGAGSKLSKIPDYEAGRLFDEWWRSVSKEEMTIYAEDGSIQEQFDQYVSQQATKH